MHNTILELEDLSFVGDSLTFERHAESKDQATIAIWGNEGYESSVVLTTEQLSQLADALRSEVLVMRGEV